MTASHNQARKSGYTLVVSVVALLGVSACETATLGSKSIYSQLENTQSPAPISEQNLNQTHPATEALDQITPPHMRVEPERIVGTGQLFAPSAMDDNRSPAPGGDVVLNFVDSDIQEVARAVFGDILSLNYVIDTQVSGKVSLATSKPIHTNQVLPLVESVFHLNGVAIVYKDGLYHIVRESEALAIGAPLSYGTTGSDKPGFSVRIVPLKFSNADEISKLIAPIIPSKAIVSVDSSRNLIIVAGDSATLARVSRTIASFDVDWMEGMSFSLIPVESPNPSDLTRSLEDIFKLGTETEDTAVRFLPLNSLGAILVASRQPSHLARAEQWVVRLDQAPAISGRQLWVYDVQFGRASELAGLLSSLFTSDGSNGYGLSGRSILAPEEQFALLQQGASLEDFIQDPAADFSPNYDSGTLAGPGQFNSNQEQTGLRIFPYETSNSLAVLATAAEYRAVESALARLDVRPMQVMLEVTIADVTLNDDLRFGVQWFFESGEFNFGLTQSKTNFGSVGVVVPGFATTFQDANASVALSALESITDVKILSRPRLLVSNNENASLQVGDQVPIVTRTSTSTLDSAATIISNVELRDTGVILNVTPRINANGLVSLEIEQEVSDVAATTTSGIDSPTIRQRRLMTNVTVDSGATIALGGLIRDDTTVTRSGIPILGDIPLLGALFSTRNHINRRSELIVLITPHVVQAPQDLEIITRELMAQISILGQ